MLLLNFTHPLTPAHLERVAALLGGALERVIDVPTHFDQSSPFPEQVRALVDRVGLTPGQWQSTPLLVNPPSLGPIACLLVAELHGRMGYFPTLLRMKPVSAPGPPQFEPAEILHLQSLRDSARQLR